MTPVVEARIVEMRRAHPGWGPRTIRTHLAREGVTPLPGRSSIYRALVRHRLLEPTPRKRSRSDYKRWERSKSMELWQMDIVGRFYLADGTEVKVVTGVDDHSRYCVCARIVARATARPVCDALTFALKQHGAPNEILTDNGKVFTARFGPGPGPVLFDRICHNNGIKHRLTAPYSPTTTGKVERFHRTYRDEFLVDHDRRHATIDEAQEALDAWVGEVQHRTSPPVPRRPTTGRAIRPGRTPRLPSTPPSSSQRSRSRRRHSRPPGVSRWVDQKGSIGLNSFRYRVGPDLRRRAGGGRRPRRPGRDPPPGCARATHAERRRDGSQGQQHQGTEGWSIPPSQFGHVRRPVGRRRRIDLLCRCRLSGRAQLAAAAASRWPSSPDRSRSPSNGKVVRVHQIRHDRSKEHGAFATPNGRPRIKKSA